jgi:hypothetical protein
MAKRRASWDFIKGNIFSLLTVVIGAIALTLNRLGLLPPDIIGPTTLTLVIFLATSQLIDQSRKLENIEASVKIGFQDTISALGGVEVIPLTEPEVGFKYLAKRVLEAGEHLNLASLSPSIPRSNPGAVEWEKAIEKVLLQNRVRFRYVCIFQDPERATRVRRHLSNPKISKFFVGYFPSEATVVPMPNFLIVDDKEVIAIFPYSYGEPEVWLSIKHPDVVQMFIKHFRRLWEDSTKITTVDIKNGLLERTPDAS